MSTEKDKVFNIPDEAMEAAEFSPEDDLIILSSPGMLLVVKREWTALDMVNICHRLDRLSSHYIRKLADLCGECDDCDGKGCSLDSDEEDEDDITLPDYLRREAGIPLDAKLCAEIYENSNVVVIRKDEFKEHLDMVPQSLKDYLVGLGACPANLVNKMMSSEVVHRA